MFYSMQICCVCGSDEFERYVTPLLASIDINSPGHKVVVWVFDADPQVEAQSRRLRQRLRSTELEFVSCCNRDDGVNTDALALSDDARIAWVLNEQLKASKVDILFVDVYSLVVRDLYVFPIVFGDVDVALPGTVVQKTSMCRSSPRFLWLRNSRATKRYASRVLDSVGSGENSLERALDASFVRFPNLQVAKTSKETFGYLKDDGEVVFQPRDEAPGGGVGDAQAEEIVRKFFAEKRVAVLCPRIDLGFKAGLETTRSAMRSRIGSPGRLYWHFFPKLIRDALESKGWSAEIICRPLWEIDRAFVSKLPHERIYIPHKNRAQISDSRAVFYMQELYPFFFTVDQEGWAASSSHYGSQAFQLIRDTVRAQEFAQTICSQQVTKYRQTSRRHVGFDVFFPLQVPSDETLRFHSEYALKEVVLAVVDWSERYGRRVLFKRHPQNPRLDYLGLTGRHLPNCRFVSDGNIHQLIDEAKVVFVVNSGVGFESLLHFKPLLVFGRAMYDSVGLKVEPRASDIEQGYQKALQSKVRKQDYLRFIEWYLFNVGTLLNRPRIDVNLPEVCQSNFQNHYYQELQYLSGSQRVGDGASKESRSRFVDQNALSRFLRRVFSWLQSAYPKVLAADFFRDRHVGLVFSGESLFRQTLGDEIDSHDVVVRTEGAYPLALVDGSAIGAPSTLTRWIDDAPVTGSVAQGDSHVLSPFAPSSLKLAHTNARHLGEKTTFWSFGIADRSQQRLGKRRFPYAFRVWTGGSLFKLDLRVWRNSWRLPASFERFLPVRQPTTNLLMFEFLRSSDVASLDIYGLESTGSGYGSRNDKIAELQHIHGTVAANSNFRLRGFRYGSIPVGYHAGERVALFGFDETDSDRFKALFPRSRVVHDSPTLRGLCSDDLERLDVFVRGRLAPEEEACLQALGIDVTRVESGPAANAWCFDRAGWYPDTSAPSELSFMLRNLELAPALEQRSNSIFLTLGYPAAKPKVSRAGRVLLLGSDKEQLRVLRQFVEPDHPTERVVELDPASCDVDVLHPFGQSSDCFANTRRIITVDSPLALTAVLRGLPVTVLGRPFFSGLGLTDDRHPDQSQICNLTRQQLFTATVLLYPRYFPSGYEFALPSAFYSAEN